MGSHMVVVALTWRFGSAFFLLDTVLFNAAFSRGCYCMMYCVKKDNQCNSANVFNFLLDYVIENDVEPAITPAPSLISEVLYSNILHLNKASL